LENVDRPTGDPALPGTVLVIGMGSLGDRDSSPYRETLLAGMARRYPLWLIDTEEPTWQLPYAMGSTLLTGRGTEHMHQAVREATAQSNVIGAFCPDEGLLLPAAIAVEALGLPGAGGDAVAACRDKKLSRERLTAAGLPQPRHSTASSPEELAEVAADLGYPVVLKPRALGGSAGVIKVSKPDEVASAYAVATAASYPGIEHSANVVVEQYLDGPEISIDGSMFDGNYQAYTIAHKELGEPPYFVETGHVVNGDDPLLDDPELHGILERAHKALGFDHGLTHSEVRFTRLGPVVIEINGRPGGDNIPRLALLSTGTDLGWIAAGMAVGLPPDTPVRRPGTVGLRFLRPERNSRLVEFPAPDPADHPGLVEAKVLVKPGDTLRTPPAQYTARYGFLIAEAADPQSCRALLDRLETEVADTIRSEPLS
jgi:hypothetical protein